LLRDIINKYIERYTPGEELIRLAVLALRGIITETAKQHDEWDNLPDGNIWKTLLHAVNTHQKRWQLIVASEEESDERKVTYCSNVIQLNNLQAVRNTIVNKLNKAQCTLAEQQTKLNKMRKGKVRRQSSIETKVFAVLKEIGVELSFYHAGSFNGKDIKKVMNNATYHFDAFC
jgi:hypothetical protein